MHSYMSSINLMSIQPQCWLKFNPDRNLSLPNKEIASISLNKKIVNGTTIILYNSTNMIYETHFLNSNFEVQFKIGIQFKNHDRSKRNIKNIVTCSLVRVANTNIFHAQN